MNLLAWLSYSYGEEADPGVQIIFFVQYHVQCSVLTANICFYATEGINTLVNALKNLS